MNTEDWIFAKAWQRQSLMIFDIIDLDVNRSKLRSEPVRAYLYQQLNGTNWPSRVWCLVIRPLFFRAQQEALEEAIRVISEVLIDEFQNSILYQAHKKGYQVATFETGLNKLRNGGVFNLIDE